MAQLIAEAKNSKLSDVMRAVIFLQRARDVRTGCKEQRNASRSAQATAWEKKVDQPVGW
jgi:hypothetical protein